MIKIMPLSGVIGGCKGGHRRHLAVFPTWSVLYLKIVFSFSVVFCFWVLGPPTHFDSPEGLTDSSVLTAIVHYSKRMQSSKGKDASGVTEPGEVYQLSLVGVA